MPVRALPFRNDHHHHKSTSAAPSLRKDGPPATRRTKAQGRGLLVYPRPVSNTRSWHLAVLRERARARARARLPRPAARARSLTMGCGGSKGKKGTAVQEQKEEPPKTKGACPQPSLATTGLTKPSHLGSARTHAAAVRVRGCASYCARTDNIQPPHAAATASRSAAPRWRCCYCACVWGAARVHLVTAECGARRSAKTGRQSAP